MKKKCGLFALLISVITSLFAHEPWLLTSQQILTLNAQPVPRLFSELTWFNITSTLFALLCVINWILFNYFYPEKLKTSAAKLNWSLLLMRLGVGSTLLFMATGALPKLDVTPLTEPTLLTPEFIISDLSHIWTDCLPIIEFILSISMIIGIGMRVCALFLLLLTIFNFFGFGIASLQYSGFYFGISLFLLTQGAGQYALQNEQKKLLSERNMLMLLQILTGLNFLYSAISIKLLKPNMDIGLLQTHHAFTFWVPYDYFTFIMLLTEATFGILFILGYRLQLIALIMLTLFLFLSISLSENLLFHNFIYGILLTFLLLGGRPLALTGDSRFFVRLH